jgi:nucleolar protein 12
VLSPHPLIAEYSADYESSSSADAGTEEDASPLPSKKRRRTAPTNDIEGAYMRRLTDQEVRNQQDIRSYARPSPITLASAVGQEPLLENVASEALDAVSIDPNPQHESLSSSFPVNAPETEKSGRTVFLGNVSIEAIKSKSARKALLNHLSSSLSSLEPTDTLHKIESLRFRSTAFASGVGPKRAAYAKKELMEETSHSTHAYVVYTTEAAAQRAATSLNGSVVLDRHLRTDLVARPADIDHRRCVFVGNLGFVDEEMVETEAESGIKERKRKRKHPADAEEGLWRTFSKAGKIESVRVVRDKSTRVGKGIAYVQFHDENSVEAALLYNDKKFPPLLPRKLRVTRARRPKKISTPSSGLKDRSPQSEMRGKTTSSRNTKWLSSARPHSGRRVHKPTSFVFEGHRATKPAEHVAKGGSKKRKHAARLTTRSSRRGAAFKAAGGKRERT